MRLSSKEGLRSAGAPCRRKFARRRAEGQRQAGFKWELALNWSVMQEALTYQAVLADRCYGEDYRAVDSFKIHDSIHIDRSHV